MICRTTIRRFDGDAGPTLHTAALARGATGLRFVAWATIDKGTGRYADAAVAPAFTIAWIPGEAITDETSSPAEVDAALGEPDQIPLIVLPRAERPVAYISDGGVAFPVVGLKGRAMALVVRVEAIAAGTHGQLTFGWEDATC